MEATALNQVSINVCFSDLKIRFLKRIESIVKKIKEKIKVAMADFPGDKNKRFPDI